jgi:hypothetical protein
MQDGGRHAIMTYQREGGASIAGGSFDTTTTVRVFDREGRELYVESTTFSESYSDTYHHESGEIFTSMVLSADGLTLTLRTSGGGERIRLLSAASETSTPPQ